MGGFKLKLLVVSMFIAALTSPANAAVSISVNGDTDIDEITIAPSDTVTIDVYNSDGGDYSCYLDFCYRSEGTYSLANPRAFCWGGDVCIDPPCGFDWDVYDDCDEFWFVVDSYYCPTPGVVFEVDLHCEGPGDVSVTLSDAGGPVDTLVIHQVDVPDPIKDLGDAPDNSNNLGIAMTAYPGTGTQANYPTVYLTGSPPYGPIHLQPGAFAYLGDSVSLEAEADTGPDTDGLNNIDPLADTSDQDNNDNGVLNLPLSLPYCQETTFDYRVTVTSAAVGVPVYVNAWFDWNRDGDWDDILDCYGQSAPEWAVQNQTLIFTSATVYTVKSHPFLPWDHLMQQPEPIWMRITLSEQQWTGSGSGGSGPADGYQYGETEDYYFTPDDCFPSDHLYHECWVQANKPECWCYPRQCHGDADGLSQGKFNYWTSANDLTILKAAWNKTFAEIEGQTVNVGGRDVPLTCADFNYDCFCHKNCIMVSVSDLTILKKYWSIANKPDPNCLPGNRTP